MSQEPSPGIDAARDVALTAVSRGMAPDLSGGEIGTPIPVRHPDGSVESWFVPVTRGDRLAGYVRITAALQFQSASSFAADAQPEAATWLDAGRVAATALQSTPGATVIGEPVLTYDRFPARIAWAVPVRLPDTVEVTVYVAGATAWRS